MDTFDDDENKENSYLSDGGDDFGGTTGFGGGNEDAYRNVLHIIVISIWRLYLDLTFGL